MKIHCIRFPYIQDILSTKVCKQKNWKLQLHGPVFPYLVIFISFFLTRFAYRGLKAENAQRKAEVRAFELKLMEIRKCQQPWFRNYSLAFDSCCSWPFPNIIPDHSFSHICLRGGQPCTKAWSGKEKLCSEPCPHNSDKLFDLCTDGQADPRWGVALEMISVIWSAVSTSLYLSLFLGQNIIQVYVPSQPDILGWSLHWR